LLKEPNDSRQIAADGLVCPGEACWHHAYLEDGFMIC